MKNIIVIILLFLTPIIKTSDEEVFYNEIKNNYDYYNIIISESNSLYDITIAIGTINDKYYVSAFLYNNDIENYRFCSQSGKRTTEAKINGKSATLYKIAFKDTTTIEIEICVPGSTQSIKSYEVVIPENQEDFKNNALIGLSEHDFPKNLISIDTLTILTIIVALFITAAIILGVVLFIIIKNRKFNHQKIDEYQDVNYEIISDNNLNTQETKPTKNETMEQLFKMAENNEITESELNQRLRALWWENDDEEDNS